MIRNSKRALQNSAAMKIVSTNDEYKYKYKFKERVLNILDYTHKK